MVKNFADIWRCFRSDDFTDNITVRILGISEREWGTGRLWCWKDVIRGLDVRNWQRFVAVRYWLLFGARSIPTSYMYSKSSDCGSDYELASSPHLREISKVNGSEVMNEICKYLERIDVPMLYGWNIVCTIK